MNKKKEATLSDYLDRYIQQDLAHEKYKEYRKKKGLSVGRSVTYDDLSRAREDSRKFLDETSWSNCSESRKRTLTKKIKAFLASLGIDNAIFKQGKQYKMTEHMVYLVDYILEDRNGAVKRIIHLEFDRVSKREYLTICSLVETAIRLGPASEEMKQQAQEDFWDFVLEHIGPLGDFPMYYENKVVEKILRYVRSAEPVKRIDQLDWEIVVEGVYERLIENGVLVIKKRKDPLTFGSMLTEQ